MSKEQWFRHYERILAGTNPNDWDDTYLERAGHEATEAMRDEYADKADILHDEAKHNDSDSGKERD